LITASAVEQKLVIGFLAQLPQREVTVKGMDVKLELIILPKIIQSLKFACLFPRNVYTENSQYVVFLERCNIYHARPTPDLPQIIFVHVVGESDTGDSGDKNLAS